MDEVSISADWAGQSLMTIIGGILLGLVILIVGRWLAGWISRLAGRYMERAHIDQTVVRFLQVLIHAALLVVVVIAALQTAGIQTTSLTALLASVGIAIGLAVKDSLANFASGVLILVQKPYKVGDAVEINGVDGSVQEVGIFSTTLNTVDNVRVIVPNSAVLSNNIRNFTSNDTRRIELVTGISYDDSIGHARDVLLGIARAHPLVLPEPAPTVDVLQLGASSVDLALRCWATTEDFWRARVEILEQIKLRFDEEGISMPYPQQEIMLRAEQPGA